MSTSISHTMVTLALALVAGLGATGFAAGPALAGARTQLVSTAGLDLQTASGRDALQKRIDRAARRVCDAGGRLDVRGIQAERRCVDEARLALGTEATALLTLKPEMAAATAWRMGTIGVPATPILH